MGALISAVIPVYNSEKYLEQCIDSVLSQTYKNLEIILIDDGSKDGSGAICDRFAEKDPRVKVRHKENAGVSAARNDGIDMASGDLIYFLDSDDWIEPELFEEAANKFSEENVDAFCFDYTLDYADKQICERAFDISEKGRIEWSSTGSLISYMKNGYMWTAVYKTSFIKDNNIRFKKNVSPIEDMLFKFSCFPFIKTIYYYNKAFLHYRQLENSAIHSSRKDYALILKNIFKEMYLQIEKENYPSNAEKVPNSKYIAYLSIVAENAFRGDSLKNAVMIINEYVNSEEYKKSLTSYDKNLIRSAGRIYVRFKNINWFVVWCVYVLRRIKKLIKRAG